MFPFEGNPSAVTTCALEVNATCWARNVGSPVMLIDRILLVDIDLKEPVVDHTLEVLVAHIMLDIL